MLAQQLVAEFSISAIQPSTVQVEFFSNGGSRDGETSLPWTCGREIALTPDWITLANERLEIEIAAQGAELIRPSPRPCRTPAARPCPFPSASTQPSAGRCRAARARMN
jgi:hypothetical protein